MITMKKCNRDTTTTTTTTTDNSYRDNIELRYNITVRTYDFFNLIKLVNADLSKILNMPLSKQVKEQAMKELFKILKDNMPE